MNLDETEQFLKRLTEAHGVPGYENEIRARLREEMKSLGELSQDRLGSLICKKGDQGPKVMLVGHMDEIGFMVTHVTKEGFLKFQQLGGWWDQVLLGHRVIIKSHKGHDVLGVIGAKPPHLLTPEDRQKIVVKRKMYIDVGATSAEEVAEIGVRPGDAVIPQSSFAVMGNKKTYLSKAFDNRIGCAVAIEVLRHYQGKPHPNQLFGVQTVMEEIGIRGATTSANAVQPDVAIILESDIAGDVPGIKPEESSVKLGGGPSVLLYDSSMIPNIPLRNLVIDTGGELGIPIQFSSMPGGGTDGGAIHKQGIGVPVVVIGVPARHIHSHGSIIHRADYERAIELTAAVVAKLDADTVASLTA